MEGFKMLKGSMFKSSLTIQANPGAVITATGPTMTYSGTADSNGLLVLTIERAGTYTITTNNTGAADAENNTATVEVLKSNSAYTGQMVKLNVPSEIKVGNYSSNVLSIYWDRPSANWTGCHVRRGNTASPSSRIDGTDIYTGAGNTIDLTYSTNVNGVNNTGLTKDSTYYYAAWAYITINGANYFAATRFTASGTARYYIGSEIKITSSQSAWAVPTGWRKLKDCVVGGGGSGGAGGSGGGGGYVTNGAEKSVKPGQTFKVVVGKGGSATSSTSAYGNNGEASSFGSDTANGGQGGAGYDTSVSGRNGGGNGGSGGGARASSSGTRVSYNGGNGGSNGTNGADSDTSTPLRYKGGVGQGTTTKAFTTGTAYGPGGGGGTQYLSSSGRSGGTGGAVGGGNGGAGGESGTNGTANSGGGGGGSGYSSSGTKSSGAGGSGVVIVRCTG